MNWFHNAYKLLITGNGCNGKTEYWIRYCWHTVAPFKFLFDAEGELGPRFGFPVATTFEELDKAARAGFVCFDPIVLFPGRIPEAFDFFCNWTFQVCKSVPGRKLFGCDELQEYCNHSSMPATLATLFETGRRYEIDFAFIATQPNAIHNRLRNKFTEVVTFQHLDINALGFLMENGFDPDEIRSLPQFVYIARHMRKQITCKGRLSW